MIGTQALVSRNNIHVDILRSAEARICETTRALEIEQMSALYRFFRRARRSAGPLLAGCSHFTVGYSRQKEDHGEIQKIGMAIQKWWDALGAGGVIIIGLVLFFFPEPVTSLIGITIIMIAGLTWLAGWFLGRNSDNQDRTGQ